MDVENESFYIKVKSLNTKRIIRIAFIDENRMEFLSDSVYEISVFACSQSFFELGTQTGICYFQCQTVAGCDLCWKMKPL